MYPYCTKLYELVKGCISLEKRKAHNRGSLVRRLYREVVMPVRNTTSDSECAMLDPDRGFFLANVPYAHLKMLSIIKKWLISAISNFFIKKIVDYVGTTCGETVSLIYRK